MRQERCVFGNSYWKRQKNAIMTMPEWRFETATPGSCTASNKGTEESFSLCVQILHIGFQGLHDLRCVKPHGCLRIMMVDYVAHG